MFHKSKFGVAHYGKGGHYDTVLYPGGGLQQQAANNLNEGVIALSQGQSSGVVSQGRVFSAPVTPVMETISAQAISTTPAPTSIEETIAKMQANGVLLANEDIVQEVLPVLLREINKGRASALQAAEALKGEAAVSYAECKNKLKGAHATDVKIIRALMAHKPFAAGLKLVRASQERVLVLMKEAAILLAQNKADAYYKTQSQLQNEVMKLAEREGKLIQFVADKGASAKMEDPSLINCLVQGAKDEAALAFTARFGLPDASASAEEQLVQGELDEEEAVSLVESADILQQAADQGVGHQEGIIAPTPEDEQLEIIEQEKNKIISSNLMKHLTPQNLLLGGLLVGGIYLLTKD